MALIDGPSLAASDLAAAVDLAVDFFLAGVSAAELKAARPRPRVRRQVRMSFIGV
jgi:hypothetical protein